MLAFLGISLSIAGPADAQTVVVDANTRYQTIDGFGASVPSADPWWQELYFDDLQASIVRADISPHFRSPYSDYGYNSPWFHGHPGLPGPDKNNVRTYTNAGDYSREWAGQSAKIAVMGPDIDRNLQYFNFDAAKAIGLAGQNGASRAEKLGDFKLMGSIWSPAPWLKIPSGNRIAGGSGVMPANGTPFPFIWNGTFAGGKVDTSDQPRPEFDDSDQGGSGPTSALTQFARSTAAWLRGVQKTYNVKFYAISIQNELNFETFYSSSFYPTSSGYITALKAIRAELDKYPDLAPIRIVGPEDLLGANAYGMWQYGTGDKAVHKNLQYLQNIARDPAALNAMDFVCVHGYAPNGMSSAGAEPSQWLWWANGWDKAPAPGLPASAKGFKAYNKRSWMTETSGEKMAWLAPQGKFPGSGAWSVALKIHQALTAGEQNGYVYWMFADKKSDEALTDATQKEKSPKYIAAKHFFRYIRPNAVRVGVKVDGAPALEASAYLHASDHSMTVVLLNASPDAVTATVNLPTSPSALQTWTSSENNYWQSGQPAVSNGSATVPVPGYGIVTLYGTGM